jgi:hypothetical protein
MQSHPSTRLADCTKECRRVGEGNRREGGSGIEDEVPTPHNLDLRHSRSREAVATAWHRGRWWWQRQCGIEGGDGGAEGGGGVEGGGKNWAAWRREKLLTGIRVSRQGVYSLYTRYVIGISWHSSPDTTNVIYGIRWRKLADTNKLLYRLAYISRYHYA